MVQKEAVSLFQEGYNCAQAVLGAMAEELGSGREEMLRVASALGGGLAGTGECCGAALGMCLVIGLAHGSTPHDKKTQEAQRDRVRAAMGEFRERFGGTTCPALKIDREHCAQIVCGAVEIARKYAR